MSDIVERLRAWDAWDPPIGFDERKGHVAPPFVSSTEAADEIERLRSLLKDREWRDISTAPKDGTQFLVTHHDWQCPAVAYYCLDADRFIFAEDALAEIDGGAFDLEGCHWMPLPPPPEKENT